MVDVGSGEPVQVVCGAPNARAGLKSVFSPPGTYIPGKNITLGVGSIRGVESRGMLCSAAELQLSEDHDGIIELPADAPVGVSYVAWAGIGDPVIDINLTPNRADCTGVLGIGGIMGGEATGCTEATTDVFIECAYFDPLTIAETGRRLGLVSDARYRFERGVDPEFLRGGLDYATQMVLDLCGGTPSEPVTTGKAPLLDRVIEFPLSEVKRLAGLDLHRVEIKHILDRLGFLTVGSTDLVRVAVPSWRADVHGRADLVEEIVRIHGVGKVPLKPLEPTNSVNGRVLTPLQIRRSRARRMLAARGLMEAVTWSFISQPLARHFGGGSPDLALANPIAADLSDMRPSLLPGLITATQRNADRGTGDIGLFEVGQIFRDDTPKGQRVVAAGVRRGTAVFAGAGRHWSGQAPAVSWADVKADVLAALEALGAPVDKLQLVRSAPAWYHPGRSGTLQLGPQTILAHFGEVHPRTLATLDVGGPLVAFEMFLDAIPEPKARASRSKGPLAASGFQEVSRDFAFVVDEAVEAEKILKAVRGADKALISDVTLFDLFRGPALGEGRKSVAVAITLSPKDRTLTDEDIEATGKKVVAAVTKATGAVLRG